MSENISDQTIVRIGELSRIDVAEEQIPQLRRQFQRIVAYFDKLREIGTEGVDAFTRPADRSNVFRSDEPADCISTIEALVNAPDREGNLFRVPNILRDGA